MERPERLAERYTLVEQLAVGGMAEIFLAEQDVALGLKRRVVIKRLRPELCGDEEVSRMFRDEARLGMLLEHPLLANIVDVGEHDGAPFLVLEYIEGEELNQLCRRGLRLGYFLPQHVAVEIVRQAAMALGYCHAAQDADGSPLELVHCDVSPNNLLVNSDGFVKLIDFGIAQFASQGRRGESVVPGKLSYMSPEQARRESLDRRSDVFSLGVILYELTLGRRLYRGPAHEVMERLCRGEVEPPTFVDHEYPGPLETIVLRALEAHPGDRYHDAYELADELAQYLRDQDAPAGPLELVRYLDELAEASGGQRRLIQPIKDHEEDLDFDRSVESAPAPWQVFKDQALEWDDPEEDAAVIAAALGVDVALVRHGAGGDAGQVGEAAVALEWFLSRRDDDGSDGGGEAGSGESSGAGDPGDVPGGGAALSSSRIAGRAGV